jgi:hypothetical protein
MAQLAGCGEVQELRQFAIRKLGKVLLVRKF